MCGVFGYLVRKAAEPVTVAGKTPAESLEPALRSLRHRGPDGEGTAVLQGPGVVGGLAHTRLAVLDPSPAGRQPMRTPDGRYTLAYNGEVYNFRSLREELEAEGVDFLSDCDTEVVLHSVARWGEAAFDRFVGMFALGLWDQVTGTLLLARDRFGEKPLYWTSDERGLAFASEVRTLLASGWAAPRLDAVGLALYLERGSCQDPTTLVDGVSALLPGHLLLAGSGGVDVRRWWAFPEGEEGQPPSEWREALHDLLETAVADRLLADVPLGVFLSGGVDSATILALAARHHRDALSAFTLSFGETSFDESAQARAVASHLGVRHHVASLTGEEALSDIEAAFDAQDLPSHDGLNTWFVSRAARKDGLVVALAGTGGDELFGGYPHFRRFPTLLRLGRMTSLLPSRIRECINDGVLPGLPTRARKSLGFLASGGDATVIYALLREVFSPVQRRELLASIAPPEGLVDPQRAAAWPDDGNPTGTLTRLEFEGYLRDTQLRDIDATSMAHSLEVRAPLLDHRLAELVVRIPEADKWCRTGVNKPLLASASGLSPTVLRGPKRGFVLPWERWLRGPLRAFAVSVLEGPATDALNLPPGVTRRTWQRFINRNLGYSRILTVVAFSRWSQRHGITSDR